MHGGYFEVKSEVGKGSEFAFVIPLVCKFQKTQMDIASTLLDKYY